MLYSENFKQKMISKMTGPDARTANSLSKEVGVAQGTLSRWLRQAKVGPMNKKGVGRRKRWTPSEKIRVVMEAAAAGESGLGELLRREGLHEADLARLREEVLQAAAKGLETERPKRGLSPEERELRDVKKELSRKEKALAEAAALLVLRGKVQAFLAGDGEGDTEESDDK